MGGKRSKYKRSRGGGGFFAKLAGVSAWKIILVAILLAFVSATLLRFDHQTMTNLKAQVLQADRDNNQERIVSSLNDLKDFVGHHIIFNLLESNGLQKIEFGTGPLYLGESYQRKAQEAIEKAQENANHQDANTNPNGNIYEKVAAVCDAEGKRNGWRYPDQPYLDCWMREIEKYPTSDRIEVLGVAELPDANLFKYEFASPIWYPCASGVVILLCLILFTWAFIKAIVSSIVYIIVLTVDKIDEKKK